MMQAAIEQESAPLVVSPGLDQFRRNPFRLLGLSTSVTAQQALWQGEKALARIRVGMTLPDPDPIPWLPPATELEIMDGMHTMESPLARLVEQLLWFDFDGDPRGAELREGLLAADGTKLGTYWAQIDESPAAHRFNQLNLRLLIAFSALRKVGPALLGRGGKQQQLSWRQEGQLAILDDVHTLLRAEEAGASSWAELLADTLRAWSRLLESAAAAEYVTAKIEALGDDLLGPDDTAAVLAAVRTRLADLVVGETKVELQRGVIENVTRLADLAGSSDLDQEVLLVAFRPLRSQFQSELASLEPDATTGAGALADITAYLDRLSSLVERWKRIDRSNLLGLETMIDEAVGEAFGRLRALDEKRQRDPQFAAQLARIGELAVANSVRDRISTFRERLARLEDSQCHFCQQRDADHDHCGYVAGENVRYVMRQLVSRCEPCARTHRLIAQFGRVTFWCVLASTLLFVFMSPPANAYGSVFVGIFAAFLFAWLATFAAAAKLIPAGHRRWNDYHSSSGARRLREEGATSMRYYGGYAAAAAIRDRPPSVREARGTLRWALQGIGGHGSGIFVTLLIVGAILGVVFLIASGGGDARLFVLLIIVVIKIARVVQSLD